MNWGVGRSSWLLIQGFHYTFLLNQWWLGMEWKSVFAKGYQSGKGNIFQKEEPYFDLENTIQPVHLFYAFVFHFDKSQNKA